MCTDNSSLVGAQFLRGGLLAQPPRRHFVFVDRPNNNRLAVTCLINNNHGGASPT